MRISERMNKEQSKKFADFLMPDGNLKSREELRALMEDETTDEVKRYSPLTQEEEY